jgi:signal transduction histidine kinase
MRALSQSLLELARFDSGQEIIQRQPFDLADKARACVELIEPLAKERGIQIHANLEPVPFSGDPTRLEQVITNLLGNAVSYNHDHGKIDISLSAHNGLAILKVTDTGHGIAPDDLPHIFKRFYRADKSRTAANTHTGLGLAITKAIVEAHGGNIKAQSPPGHGATFTVCLPSTGLN